MARYPDVQVSRDNIEHYRGLAGRRLLINHCGDCHTWIYPHRPICPVCWSWNVKAEEVSGLGMGRAGHANHYPEAVRQMRGNEGARQFAQVPEAALIAIGCSFRDPSTMVLRA